MEAFLFRDYRAFIRGQVEKHAITRGYQTSLAKAAGCTRSFLSQVLHSHVQLTPDHAAGMCRFWGLSEDETDWFMELLTFDRAGSAPLRELSRRRMKQLEKKREDLSRRLEPLHALSTQDHANYYASWHLAAIHMLCCIPSYSHVTEIARRLGLPFEVVESGLAFLQRTGLVRRRGDKWSATEKNLHLPKSSPYGTANHLNWRLRAIHTLQKQEDGALHYTAVHALSRTDRDRIRAILLETIEKSREIVSQSPEEELVCFTCDIFPV